MNKGLRILKWIALGALFFVLFGCITMLLWNWLVPELFNGPEVGFWQALGLVVLSKILFGGFGGGHKSGRGHWKHRYHEKLANMTPEERERFKARVREKWCSSGKNEGTGEHSSNV